MIIELAPASAVLERAKRAWCLASHAARLARYRVLFALHFKKQSLDALLARFLEPRAVPSNLELTELAKIVACVEHALERIPFLPDSCLFRSLARFALLRGNGQPAIFVLGVAAKPSEPGHAWVELAGAAWAEPEEISRFRPTFRYP